MSSLYYESIDLASNGNAGGAISVPSDQIFDNAAARDTFFSSNPDKLIDDAQCIVLTNPPEGLYQVYTSGAWQNRTAIVIGPKGDQPFTTVKVTMLPDGSNPTSVINGDELDLGIPRSGASPSVRQASRYLGMFETEQEMNSDEPSPRAGSQCVVLTPQQHYYEYTNGAWVKGRAVGDAHSGYLGRYPDEATLKSTHPTAPKDSTAIADKAWHIYETNAWEPLQDDHIPAIDNKLQSIEEGQRVLTSDLSQKISGINIEDDEGNSFSDITGLAFDGATVQDDQGTGLSSVIVKPKITVANGQEPDSKSFIGNALIFEGADIEPDSNNPKVIKVLGIGSHSSPKFDPSMFQSAVDHGYAADDQGVKSNQTTDGWWIFKDLDGVSGRPSGSIGDVILFKNTVATVAGLKHVFLMALGQDKSTGNHVWFQYRDGTSWTPWFDSSNDQAQIDGIHASIEDLKKADANAVGEIGKLYGVVGGIYAPTKALFDKEVNLLIGVNRAPIEVDGTSYSYNELEFSDFTAAKNGDKLILTAPSSPGGDSGIEIDNGVSNIAGVKKLNFPTSEIQARSPTEVDITPYFKANAHDGSEALIEELNILPPMQLNKQQGQDYKYDLLVDPSAYEAQHSKSCLISPSGDVKIKGGVATAVFCDSEIVPFGEYFSPNPAKSGVNVQDNSGGDTALTGGQLTEVMAVVGFVGIAEEDATIQVWFEYHDPSSPLAPSVLEDVNGNPVINRVQVTAGKSIDDMLIVGAMMAKGQAPLVLKVETGFTQSDLTIIDTDKTMICINQFSDGYETSIARLEFERRTGFTITPEIHTFDTTFLSLSDMLSGVSQAEQVVPAGQSSDLANNYGMVTISDVKTGIDNNAVIVKSNTGVTDYYIDAILDHDRTIMMRGKTISAHVMMKNPDNAFRAALYAYTGKGDEFPNLYNGRTDDAVNINAGWVKISDVFFIEQVDGQSHANTVVGTVPEGANNIGFFVYPNGAQDPSSLTLEAFDLGTPTKFTGYIEKERGHSGYEHFRFSKNYGEFILNNKGFQSIRYTINNNLEGNPMPVGYRIKGKANLVVDNSLNQVPGSADPKNDGTIVMPEDGQVSISKSYTVWNEQGTDNTVTFWDLLFDVDGNPTKIPESERTFTVKANSNGTMFDIPAYTLEVEKGQSIGGRASSNKADGAFIQSASPAQYAVQVVIEFDSIVNDLSDDPWQSIDFTQYTASYFNNVVVSKTVENSDTATFIVDLPIGGNFTIMEVLQEDPDVIGSITGKNDFSFEWDKITKEITFDFKKVGSYRIMMMLSI